MDDQILEYYFHSQTTNNQTVAKIFNEVHSTSNDKIIYNMS